MPLSMEDRSLGVLELSWRRRIYLDYIVGCGSSFIDVFGFDGLLICVQKVGSK